jgi:hypothetical protein
MSKDAKGHGSESRGGVSSPAVKANIKKAVQLAHTLGPDHPSVGAALHDAIMATRPPGGFYKIGGSGGQPVESNAHAAATLAGGGDKSAPVDTHPAMSGKAGPLPNDIGWKSRVKVNAAAGRGPHPNDISQNAWKSRVKVSINAAAGKGK